MWKWLLPITILVVATGVAIMIAWTTINRLLTGHSTEINWPLTLLALLFILLAAALFVFFANRLAQESGHSER